MISLKLQHEAHLRQQKILKEKWRRYELQREKARKEREKKREEMEMESQKLKQTQSENETPGVEDIELVDSKKAISSVSSLVISAENFSVASSVSSLSEASAAKDAKTPTQEIDSQVSELKIQILSLSQELENSNRENTKLKQTIQILKEFVKERHGVEVLESVLESRCNTRENSDYTELVSYSPAAERIEAACILRSSRDDRIFEGAQSQESEGLEGSSGVDNIEDFMQSTQSKERQLARSVCPEHEVNKVKDIHLPPLEVPQFQFGND